MLEHASTDGTQLTIAKNDRRAFLNPASQAFPRHHHALA
jgi:hypothetical protein